MLDFGFYNMDCLKGMKQFPDGYFDLAIVDPPYGNALENQGGGTGIHRQKKNCRKPDGTWGYANWRDVGDKVCKKIETWDIAPKEDYFKELFRVSRNQIIWGGNYFSLPPTRCFLVWRKLTISESFSMAMAEYAWTSFNQNAKVFEHVPQDNTGKRFHPTQKPIALYEWILNKYAKEGDIILDTHVGSASSLIACHRTRHKFVGFEIDEEYYRLAKERLDAEMAQMTIYDFMES
jgi:site-specific DNA-methyltransferase (adenine-specific)